MKGKYFLAKPPHGDLNYVHISHYQSTEHDSEQYCAAFCGHGALHISSAADLQSSGIVNQHAQGRGLGAVEADPMLSNRRKRRFSSIGSATMNTVITNRFLPLPDVKTIEPSGAATESRTLECSSSIWREQDTSPIDH